MDTPSMTPATVTILSVIVLLFSCEMGLLCRSGYCNVESEHTRRKNIHRVPRKPPALLGDIFSARRGIFFPHGGRYFSRTEGIFFPHGGRYFFRTEGIFSSTLLVRRDYSPFNVIPPSTLSPSIAGGFPGETTGTVFLGQASLTALRSRLRAQTRT